jgi:hypothetical protein
LPWRWETKIMSKFLANINAQDAATLSSTVNHTLPAISEMQGFSGF